MNTTDFEDSEDYYYVPDDYDYYLEDDDYSRSSKRQNYYYEFDLRYYDYYDYSYYSQWNYYYTVEAHSAIDEYDDYYADYYGYDSDYYYDEYYYDEDLEPLWYEFVVNEEVGSWGVVMTYDETLQEFYLGTASNDVCLLNLDPDFTYFTVHDCPDCHCDFASEAGWTESSLVMDMESEEISPLYMTGPWGN